MTMDFLGIKTNVAYRGFKIGDKVTRKAKGNFVTGTIKSLKNDLTCLVENESGDIVEKKYDEISKAE